jgi:hypothetical protein
MSAVARIVRLCALLTLILGGVASHDVAMASGAMHEGHISVDVASTMTHHHSDNGCTGSTCDQQEPACCVMGQCLIGIAPVADYRFLTAELPQPEAYPERLPITGFAWAPFRPPAVG